MTPEQAAKLRKGDEVLVRCVIAATERAPEPSWVFVHAEHDAHGPFMYVKVEAIHSALPRPLEAGDRVMKFDDNGTIIAVFGHAAWVKWEADEEPEVWPLSDLQRVEDQ